ncbi:uncharacterized protein LOC114529975 [Dendronephthya gigantea]|uniref:uncharacterized protein LOC114529975 n=1 Tax=Dendronephthya gigantea TaxID=151771 RepID=UPI001068E27F|nr:uncharacterized protein LOC114529975 [Dendronephthya gigantea]
MDSTELELAKFESIEWSPAYLSLSKLLDKYPLPQIVKIIEGFYGERNDSTLCNNAILCLHSVRTVQKVYGHLGCDTGKEILIPLDCRSKVEVRASNMKDVYESVEELCSVSPKYVRVSQAYHRESSNEALLNVGDKLQLKGNNKRKMKENLVCINQNGQKIELPKDCVACFQPLVDGKEYYLSDALKKFKMPLKVQFVELDRIGEDARSDNRPPCEPFRIICLDKISKEKVVEATTILADGQKLSMQISPDVNIELVVCADSFRNNADYAKICQMFNQATTPSEDSNAQLYEDIDDAIRNITRSKPTKPSVKRSSQKQKPVVSPKPKPRNLTLARADPDPTYEEIGLNTKDEREPVIEESQYTALDPTYISSQKYEKPVMEQQQIQSFRNPLKMAQKPPPVPKKAVKIPTNVSSEVKKCNKPDVLYSEPDQPTLSKPPVTHPKNPHSIPECPARTPDAHSSPHLSRHPVVEPESKNEGNYLAIAEYPLDLSNLKVADVGRLLEYLGMKKHVEIFRKEMVDGSMLACMDRESLHSLDVDPFHAKKLLRFIGGWRPKM